ncbi:MAG: radical SAM family heme chaperone HemW [Alphaproteobacteria bacterium]|nr:radical SAM family heme chaperone HemW [Alphaproteobacteria bacterium]
MSTAHNIYIHVPFCVKKCNYCAFFSHACAAPDWDAYKNQITSEIRHWRRKIGNVAVPTIFFGGGTPSLMPAAVFGNIMDELRANFDVVSDAEITIEANPGTIDINKLNEFCAMGVNRLSVGVQSFDDARLKFLGRIHSANDARRLLDSALERGIRVSADFIYGLPGDSVKDVTRMCDQINQIGISHCSLYELTIEKDTSFGKMNLNMPGNEIMAEMYNAISKTLKLKLARYEVSNYATPGDECRHNMNVWDGEPYIGIGPGAAGRIFMDGVWYEELGAGKMFSPITNECRAMERVITGLRTMRGVRMDSDVEKIINLEFAKSHPDMLTFVGDRIAATDAGIMVLDNLLTKLVK